MRSCGEEFTNKLPPESERKIFNTIELQQVLKNLVITKLESFICASYLFQNKDQYFLDSANKISIFFEAEVLEEDGKLKVHPRVSLNKVNAQF